MLLNAHPFRTGMSYSGDMDGASTGWSNTARSRWALVRPKGSTDEPTDPDKRILSRRKSNYAGIGDEITLRWQRGALVLPWGQDAEGGAARPPVEEVFLDILR